MKQNKTIFKNSPIRTINSKSTNKNIITMTTNNNIFDTLLPAFGTSSQASDMPIWDESQKMFISGQYTSAAGNVYYIGVRFCSHLVVRIKVGLWNSWTYLNGIELYRFGGMGLTLIQKKDSYDKKFYDEDFVRSECETMLGNYYRSQLKLQGQSLSDSEIEARAAVVVESCYKSFLDADFDNRLTKVLPLLKQNDND